MLAGEGRSRSWPLQRLGLGLLLSLLVGCATDRAQLAQALRSPADLGRPTADIQASYRVACPDLLDIQIAQRPDLSGLRQIDADGCIKLAPGLRIRVEGQTTAEIAAELARNGSQPVETIQIQLADYLSRQIYVDGQVVGMPRAVPYQGEETVLDLLQRIGGLTSGAAIDQVQVVRSHVMDGAAPEVLRIDLAGILLRNDPRTNVVLQPFDHVYVGETRRCWLKRCVPPWLRPLYDVCCGMSGPIDAMPAPTFLPLLSPRPTHLPEMAEPGPPPRPLPRETTPR